jgi:hypothetical protein
MLPSLRFLHFTLLVAAVALVSYPGAQAYAQMAHAKHRATQNQADQIEKKQKAKEADEAYRAKLREIPNKPKADPWGGMR